MFFPDDFTVLRQHSDAELLDIEVIIIIYWNQIILDKKEWIWESYQMILLESLLTIKRVSQVLHFLFFFVYVTGNIWIVWN